MVDGATGWFVQAYNAQAAVDAGSQVIAAAALTQEADGAAAVSPAAARADRRGSRRAAAQGQRRRQLLRRRQPAPTPLSLRSSATCRRRSACEEVRDRRRPVREKLAGKEGRAVYAQRKAVDRAGLRAGRGGARLSPLVAARSRAGRRGMAAHLPDAQPAQAAPFGSLATPRLRGQERRRFGGLQAPLARGALQRTGAADPAVSAQGDPLLLMLRHPARAFHDMIARQAPSAMRSKPGSIPRDIPSHPLLRSLRTFPMRA